MSRKRIILPVFCGILTYSLMSYGFGPAGVVPMRRLEAEKERLAQNIAQLEGIHAELDADFRNLSSDPDTIAMYAHELGYVAENERLIKLADFMGGIEREYSPGDAMTATLPETVPEWVCKLLGLLAGACAFALITKFMPEATHDSLEKRAGIGPYYSGIPTR